MIFLFRSGTLREKIGLIFRATKTHAQNLAKYATIYKTTMLALKYSGSNRGQEGKWDTFFAGLLGGYVVFGRRSKKGHVSSVSKQIVIFGMHWPSHTSHTSSMIYGPLISLVSYSICKSMSRVSTTRRQTFVRHYPKSRTRRPNIP
jgi:hypothetical protein